MLTAQDISFILESLKYTKEAFERYPYPSDEIKQGRLQDVDCVIHKLREMKKGLKAK